MLHVASRGCASEDEISSLVGHFTFRALVRRELLATFSAAYAFSQRGGRLRRRLRVSVIRELRVAASLIFLAHRAMGWCGSCRSGTKYGGERNGNFHDGWRFCRRQEFDAESRSEIEVATDPSAFRA